MTTSTKQKVGLSAKILGAVTLIGTVTTVIVQVHGAVAEIRASSTDARQKAIAGYEVLEPAVKELQDVADDTSDWAEAVDKEIEDLYRAKDALEDRVAQLEGYIRALRPNLISDEEPTLPEAVPPPPPREEARPKRRANKPDREIPDDIDKAQRTLF